MNRFGALNERAFRLLWLGQSLSGIGDALTPVALAFAVLQVGGGPGSLGVVLAAFTIGRAAFILVGGVWADRLPRRVVMLTCDLVRAAIQAATAAALLTDVMEVWMFVAASFALGTAQAFFGPASTGLVPETVSAERLQQANGLLSLSRSAIEIFGPITAGVLVAATQPAWVFAVDAVSFVASAAFLAVLPIARREVEVRQRFLADLVDGCREAWSRGWLRAGFLLAGSANIGLGIFFVLGPIVADRELGGAKAWGVALTGGAIGAVAGAAIALRVRPRRPIMAAFLIWSLGALPLLALVPPVPAVLLAVATGLFTLGVTYGNAVYEAVLQREIPPERLSRVSSFDWMISIVFMPLGQTLAGPLANVFGVDAVLIAGALLIVVSCAAGAATPSVRSLRARPSPAPASGSERESPVPVPPAPLP